MQFQTRIRWYEDIEHLSVVYLDESGFALDEPRTHGYANRGTRCYGRQDWHAKGRFNAIGALIGFTLLAVQLWECNIDSDVFLQWVVTALLPVLPKQSVIVLDGAPFHKRSDIIDAMEREGYIVEFLPSCSPDLNPIEKKWAQAKAIRQRERYDPHTLFSWYDL